MKLATEIGRLLLDGLLVMVMCVCVFGLMGVIFGSFGLPAWGIYLISRGRYIHGSLLCFAGLVCGCVWFGVEARSPGFLDI